MIGPWLRWAFNMVSEEFMVKLEGHMAQTSVGLKGLNIGYEYIWVTFQKRFS